MDTQGQHHYQRYVESPKTDPKTDPICGKKKIIIINKITIEPLIFR